MRNHQTLDGLFDAMRDEHAVAHGALARIVDLEAKSSAVRYRWRPIGGVAVLATLVLGTSILMLGTPSDEEPDSHNGVSTPMPTSATQTASTDIDPTRAAVADTDRIRSGRGEDVDGGFTPATGEPVATEADARQGSAVVRGGRSFLVAYDRDAREKWKEYLRRNRSNDADAMSPRATVEVEGTNVIRLGREELAAIGVHRNGNGVVECYARSVAFTRSSSNPDAVELEDTRLTLTPTRGRTTLISSDAIPGGVEPTLLPELITDGTGNAYLFDGQARRIELPEHVQRVRDSIERRRLARPRLANALIPIRVSGSPLAINEGSDDDIILWYRPDPRLIAALPPCLREQLLSELDSAASGRADDLERGRRNMRAAMTPELQHRFDSILAAGRRVAEPCSRPVVGRPLLDLWRSTGGAIVAARLTPNTIDQTGELSIELSDNRDVEVWLHTIDGARVRRLAHAVHMQSGPGSISIDADAVRPGLYLFVIQTDRGERAVLRAMME